MAHSAPRPRHLLGAITRYCGEHGMAESRFGRQAVGDPRLVGDVPKGRDLRPATVARVEAFLAGEA